MPRFSVSLPEDLSEWVESESEDRGVSKAKIIRDAVERAKHSEGVQRDTNLVQSDEVLSQVDELRERVEYLEANFSEGNRDDDGGVEIDEDVSTTEDIIERFREQVRETPPETEHGTEAVVRTFEILYENGPMKTSVVRDRVFEDIQGDFSSSRSMWQSIQRYFGDDIPAIEKEGYGKWRANPDAVPQ